MFERFVENVEDAYQSLLLCLNENQRISDDSENFTLYGTFVIQTDIVDNIHSLYDRRRKSKTAFKFIKK